MASNETAEVGDGSPVNNESIRPKSVKSKGKKTREAEQIDFESGLISEITDSMAQYSLQDRYDLRLGASQLGHASMHLLQNKTKGQGPAQKTRQLQTKGPPRVQYHSEEAKPAFNSKDISLKRQAERPSIKRTQVVPEASSVYLSNCKIQTQILESPQPLLLILDLNGTLLYRTQSGKHGTRTAIPRPHLHDFLQWLLNEELHATMIWSSVFPSNLEKMIEKTFTEDQARKLIARWGRDTLHLEPNAYKQRVQVYKRLEWIWLDESIQASYPEDMSKALGIPVEMRKWGQHNTILIDDSSEKAVCEPYNHILIPEYLGPKAEMKLDEAKVNILGQVRTAIEQASFAANVSNFLCSNRSLAVLGNDSPAKTRLT